MSAELVAQKITMACALRDRHREEDAISLLREAIAQDPENAEAHFQLSLTLLGLDRRKRDALDAVEKAIECSPEDAHSHALRANILASLKRARDAHESANEAVRLEPESPHSHYAKAQVYAAQERWAEAEQSLRTALSFDADHETAGNMLAQVQRFQNKLEDSDDTISQLLSENPESAYAHFNAGWAALQKNDHRQAEGHFREALRLEAGFEPAREGLIQSFRSRSKPYQWYLQYSFFMQQFTTKARVLIIVGFLVGVNLGSKLLATWHPAASAALITAYLILVLWSWLAPGVGSFLILGDRSARYALRRTEKLEGIFTGGGFLVGLLLLFGGFGLGWSAVAALGACLALGSVPASLTFTNESRTGRILFGSLFALAAAGALAALYAALFNGGMHLPINWRMVTWSALAAIACTWLGNLPSLREYRE